MANEFVRVSAYPLLEDRHVFSQHNWFEVHRKSLVAVLEDLCELSELTIAFEDLPQPGPLPDYEDKEVLDLEYLKKYDRDFNTLVACRVLLAMRMGTPEIVSDEEMGYIIGGVLCRLFEAKLVRKIYCACCEREFTPENFSVKPWETEDTWGFSAYCVHSHHVYSEFTLSIC